MDIDLAELFGCGKPYKGFTNLEPGNYKILKFSLVRNRFFNPNVEGSLPRTLLVELEDQVLFLPSYMAVNFNNNETLIEKLNNSPSKKILCFEGRRVDK